MSTPPYWLRAALRLHDVYRGRAGQAAEQSFLGRLADWQPSVRGVCGLLRHAVTAGRLAAALPLRRQLHRLLRYVGAVAAETQRDLGEAPQPAPTARDFLADFRQLADEFGELHLDLRAKTLVVVTEPVELEDVYLGPFRVRLTWDRLARDADVHCFKVEALDPQPAAADRLVTHPHVRDNALCPGEAAAPIRRALEQGRLADAFLLVRGVLTTYNAASPHVALDEWSGAGCHDCGTSARGDDLSHCAACGHDYCADCISSCAGCNESRCNECLGRCVACEESFCSGCLRRSAHSGRRCCGNCLAACAVYEESVATDEIDPQSRTCPACTPVCAEATTATDAPEPHQPPPTETDHEPVPVAAAAP